MEYIKTDLKMLITGGFNNLWEPYRPGSNIELLCAEPNCYLVHEKITRGMNQLGWAVLCLGRLAVLFDWACRIERQKSGFGCHVDLLM